MKIDHERNCDIIQVVLGLVFLVSGVLKSIDVYGTILKLDEYAQVLKLPLLQSYDEAIAVILCTIETTLGLWMLTFIYRRLSTTVLIGLTSCFTLLNIYFIQNPDKMITDCGCFGEMFPMDMTESLIKNIIILILACYLLWHQRHNKPMFWELPNALIGFFASVSMLLSLLPIGNTSFYNPTGYDDGTNLREKENFVILDDNGEDVTDKLLNESDEIYIYVYKTGLPLYRRDVRKYCEKNKHSFFILTDKPFTEYNHNEDRVYYIDETTSKSLMRTKENGIVYVRKGIIKKTWAETNTWWKLDIDD